MRSKSSPRRVLVAPERLPELLSRHSSPPCLLEGCDQRGYVEANTGGSAHDAHSKNYSLLLEGPDSPRLAPLYDLLCTSVYPGTSKKLAMKYGGEYRPAYVRGRHLDRLAADLELRPSLLRRRAAQLIERVTSAIEPARAGLPGDFQEGETLDAVTALVGERAGGLSAAGKEAEG